MKFSKPEQRIGLVAAAAIVVVLVVWFMAFWKPEGSSLRAAQKSEAQAAAQVASEQAQIATLKADAPKVAKEKAVLNRLVQEVPDGPSLDQMLVTVNRAAAAAMCGVKALKDPGTTKFSRSVT